MTLVSTGLLSKAREFCEAFVREAHCNKYVCTACPHASVEQHCVLYAVDSWVNKMMAKGGANDLTS